MGFDHRAGHDTCGGTTVAPLPGSGWPHGKIASHGRASKSSLPPRDSSSRSLVFVLVDRPRDTSAVHPDLPRCLGAKALRSSPAAPPNPPDRHPYPTRIRRSNSRPDQDPERSAPHEPWKIADLARRRPGNTRGPARSATAGATDPPSAPNSGATMGSEMTGFRFLCLRLAPEPMGGLPFGRARPARSLRAGLRGCRRPSGATFQPAAAPRRLRVPGSGRGVALEPMGGLEPPAC